MGGNTSLLRPFGITRDAAGRIYVANDGTNAITVYAPGATGNAAPVAEIGGNKHWDKSALRHRPRCHRPALRPKQQHQQHYRVRSGRDRECRPHGHDRGEQHEPASRERHRQRRHKTLKAATARPPQAHLAAQQRGFDRFRQRYNEERPHEALGDATPASCYAPSPRPYRPTLEPLGYPGHYERRLVSRNGGVRWKHRWVNASHLFAELEIGFEEIDDGLWNVYFGPVRLGRFHEEVGQIVDQLGRPIRRQGDNHKGRTYTKVLPIT